MKILQRLLFSYVLLMYCSFSLLSCISPDDGESLFIAVRLFVGPFTGQEVNHVSHRRNDGQSYRRLLLRTCPAQGSRQQINDPDQDDQAQSNGSRLVPGIVVHGKDQRRANAAGTHQSQH